jgi:hypothetical protein
MPASRLWIMTLEQSTRGFSIHCSIYSRAWIDVEYTSTCLNSFDYPVIALGTPEWT